VVEAIMRIALMIGVVVGGLMLSSCASTGHFIADTLPPWAGGLPPDAPPRQGTPGYRDYLRGISGEDTAAAPATTAPATAVPATTAPATTASATSVRAALPANPPPPRQAPDPIDQPIH
jgi:hypothetical protein